MSRPALNHYLGVARGETHIPEIQQNELIQFVQENWENKGKMREVQKAKNQLTSAYIGLVISIAKSSLRPGLELDDLIQEGSLGLMRAIKKFDPNHGAKFYSYAAIWIRQFVNLFVGRGIVHVPLHIRANLRSVDRYKMHLSKELGREATVGELAEAMDVSAKSIQELLGLDRREVSLDAPLSDERGAKRLGDTIPDGQPGADELLEGCDIRAEIGRALAGLDSQAEQVVRRRFGFNGDEEGLGEIGASYDVSKEWIRQIEGKALVQLHHSEVLAEANAIIWARESRRLEGVFNSSSIPGADKKAIKGYFGIGTEVLTMKEIAMERGVEPGKVRKMLTGILCEILWQKKEDMHAILTSCESSTDPRIEEFMRSFNRLKK